MANMTKKKLCHCRKINNVVLRIWHKKLLKNHSNISVQMHLSFSSLLDLVVEKRVKTIKHVELPCFGLEPS